MATLGIVAAKLKDKDVLITLEDGHTLLYPDCWLRDHCRCSECYRLDTFQRSKHVLDIPDSKIHNLDISNPEQLKVTWDDKHESSYSLGFLLKYDYKTWYEGSRLKPILWNGPNISTEVANVHVNEFLKSVDGTKKVFQSLLDYGIAFINEVEPTLPATEVICRALGGIQHTLFGGLWTLTTEVQHADTAYTNVPLAEHTDNTYFTEAAGLQIFHCIRHSEGSGGETVLVDGFYGATRLKEDHPEHFETLSTTHTEAEFIEDGHHHKYSAPIIKVDGRTGDMEQIRFNVYDRSPMPFSNSSDCRSYYEAIRNLSRYYEDINNQYQFKLLPGTVVAIDNFRVLHGRRGFTGNRMLCGSYVARSDWLDRARAFKLIQ